MDDNTRQVLIALASALGGFATGVMVAKIGFDHARTLERERAAREDRHRNRAEKIAAFAAFLNAMETFYERHAREETALELGQDVVDAGPYSTDGNTALQTIAILAPAVAVKAQALHSWMVMQGVWITERRLQSLGLDVGHPIQELDPSEFGRLRGDVVTAMQLDLGTVTADDAELT